MKALYNFTSPDVAHLILCLLVIQAVLVSLESIYNHRLYDNNHLLSWNIHRQYNLNLARSFKTAFLDLIFSYPNILALITIRLLLALAFFLLPMNNRNTEYWLIPFLFTSILSGMRNKYGNNGSDQLASILLIVISIIYWTGNTGFIRNISIFFIACQASLRAFFIILKPYSMKKIYILSITISIALNVTAQQLPADHPQLIPVHAGDSFVVRTNIARVNKKPLLGTILRITGAGMAAYQTGKIIGDKSGQERKSASNLWIPSAGVGLVLFGNDIASLKTPHHAYVGYTLFDTDNKVVATDRVGLDNRSIRKNGGILLSGRVEQDGFLRLEGTPGKLKDPNLLLDWMPAAAPIPSSPSMLKSAIVVPRAAITTPPAIRVTPPSIIKHSFSLPALPSVPSRKNILTAPSPSFPAPARLRRAPSLPGLSRVKTPLQPILQGPAAPDFKRPAAPEKGIPQAPLLTRVDWIDRKNEEETEVAMKKEEEDEDDEDDFGDCQDGYCFPEDDGDGGGGDGGGDGGDGGDGGEDGSYGDDSDTSYEVDTSDDSDDSSDSEDPDCDPSDPNDDCYDPCVADPSGADCACMQDPEYCTNPCDSDPYGDECTTLCNQFDQINQQAEIIQGDGTFQVPSSIADNLPSGFSLQTLDNATGSDVNADFYSMHISDLPTGMTMDDLLEEFRTGINYFTGDTGVSFEPYNYDGVDSTSQFNAPGTDSVGALVHIDLPNDGTVVESRYVQDQTNPNGTVTSSFTYTTVNSPLDGDHPVSGNRTFGIQTDPVNGGYTFYISGVDRATNPAFNLGAALGGWDDANTLWTTAITQMMHFVTDNGGSAGTYTNGEFADQMDYTNAQGYLNGSQSASEWKASLGCPS